MRNFIKTIINGVQNWTKKEIKKSTADWNQNDSSAADYVKNRTHYIDNDVILPEAVLDNGVAIKFNEILLENETYTVIADGNVYTCKTYKSDIFYGAPLLLGNETIVADLWGHPGAIDTGEPFVFMLCKVDGDKCEYYIHSKTDKITISVIGPYVKRISDMYLPRNIFTTSNGFNIGYNTIASGHSSHAEGMNTTASGFCAHAEGYDTTASGDFSHAEGTGTASGDYSHAEGSITIASGSSSHAEGNYTTASGYSSHAEGNDTTAAGRCSHAEGEYTTASGHSSHAEGMWNNPEKLNSVYGFDASEINTSPTLDTVTISKNFTFDESTGKFTLCSPTLQVSKDDLLLYINYAMIHGDCETADEVYVIKGKSTNASYPYATVRYTASESSTMRGYIHSVGNGSHKYPSNAHTIDYFGVGWFQGGLQVGGHAQDDGARNVLLEGDAVKLEGVEITLPYNYVCDSITYGNGKFVAVAYRFVEYSEDGISWKATTLPSANVWRSVTYGDGKFVAVGDTSSAAYSEDGINWVATTLPSANAWRSVTYGDGKFVAIDNGTTTAAYSEDGINWEATTLPPANSWYSVTYGNGKFVAIDHRTTAAAYSEDGINWVATTLPSSKFYSVTYGNGKFVAVNGDTSSAAYSEDGINWVATTLPSVYWNSVTYGNGKFVAVGDTSSAAYSEDGINWVATTLPSSKFYSVTYGNGKFVAVADTHSAYSEDGINWCNTYGILSQENKDVTTEVRGLVLPISNTTQVGQTIVVKTVDENGKPTEWGTIALPSIDGLATEEYVDTSIANLVDSAPETLNTLNELATAIQENDNVIDTLNAAITNKITVPQDAAAGDLLTYNGTSWVRISRADLITEIIAALPRAEEATF